MLHVFKTNLYNIKLVITVCLRSALFPVKME